MNLEFSAVINALAVRVLAELVAMVSPRSTEEVVKETLHEAHKIYETLSEEQIQEIVTALGNLDGDGEC